MDKTQKLRRYRRKSYSQVVDFPVEIIGRDGLVRQYSFEESVRLYQRRIASADVRYTDSEIMNAEKDHCRRRIEQLRRSFFARYGWPAIEVVDSNGSEPGVLSGEVAAFLRRCLSVIDPEPERFEFSLLDTSDESRVYFVKPPESEMVEVDVGVGHFLLYVYEFDSPVGCQKRESFFQFIKVLDGLGGQRAMAVESLVAFHHTSDCGLVLTGSGDIPDIDAEDGSEEFELSWGPDSQPKRDDFDEGMSFLRRGLFKEALERFARAYSVHHFRRVAYLGAAIVADQMGDDSEVETATVMGMRYFPGDPALAYHRAVNLVRQQKYQQARALLSTIQDWPTGPMTPQLLSAVCFLAEKKIARGRELLQGINGGGFVTDPQLERVHRWLKAQLRARDVLMAICAVTAASGGAVAVGGSLVGMLVATLGLAGMRAVNTTWHAQLCRMIQNRSRRIHLASSGMLMNASDDEVIQ